jgi:ubiquinone/menaquinone biosynthesis C-methylase UbiE
MLVEKIYKNRFSKIEERKILWDVLVKNYFQNFIKKNDTVVDIPCGYGEFINYIKCKKKYAVDINPDSKKFLNKDVIFFRASSTKLPLKSSTVDKIFCSNFFEHLDREDITKTISEFKRILKPKGQVLVLQPNIRFASRDYWMFFDHVTPIDDRALEEAFNLSGFAIKKRVLRFLPYTTQGNLPTSKLLVGLYIHLPFVWRFLGKQSFMIFQT